MGVWKRTLLLTAGAGLSALAYVPFIAANSTEAVSSSLYLLFPLGNMLILGALALLGFKLADKLTIPMPMLRAFETGQKSEEGWASIALPALQWCVVPSAVIIVTIFCLDMPTSQGSYWVRALSTGFAAINLQIITLLIFTSLLFWVIKKPVLTALLGGVLLAALHLGGSGIGEFTVLQALFNGMMGSIFAWLYLRHSFESAIIGHAIGHLIVMSL